MTKVEINFSNYKQILKFKKGLNIFIAPNGCGKTLLGKVLSGTIKDNRVKHSFKNNFIYINCLTDTLIADDIIKNIIIEDFNLKDALHSKESFESDGLMRLSYIIDKVINTDKDLYIDLPETCLHIGLQRHFMDYLEENIGNRTIIVTTHSAYIVDARFDLYADKQVKILKEE